MNIKLTPELRIALELRHSKVRDGYKRDRIKAVLLHAKGWTIVMIAQALLVHESTTARHIKDFIAEHKLTPDNGGSFSHLDDEQTKQLIEHLSDITYFHTHQICSYIQATFDVNYSVSGLNKWLHHNGFSYKQPKGVPYKICPSKQDEFIAKYELLKAEMAENDVLLFMDAVHPTQATKVTCGWIRTGVDKTIETTGSRTRVNIVGAIRLGYLKDTVTQQYEKTVNGDAIIDFFTHIKEKYKDKNVINLVLDGAGYHRKKEVVDKAKELGIALHYLPAYSPNLNPIEWLWKVMNEHARNNKYFATAKDFRRSLNHFFDATLPTIGATLSGRINDNFQKFYPAT
jgi:transposase